MDPIIIYIIIGAAALILGIILGKLVFAKNTKKQLEDAEQQAQKIIADGQLQAENLKKEKVLEAKEKCGMGVEKDGCCKTELKTLKVKDTHIAADAINNPVKHFSEIIIFNQSFETVATVQQQVIVSNPGHAPPLHPGTPLYISNCTYRI